MIPNFADLCFLQLEVLLGQIKSLLYIHNLLKVKQMVRAISKNMSIEGWRYFNMINWGRSRQNLYHSQYSTHNVSMTQCKTVVSSVRYQQRYCSLAWSHWSELLFIWICCIHHVHLCRDHFLHAPSQWETMLPCNFISRWLGTYRKWSLIYVMWRVWTLHSDRFQSLYLPFSVEFKVLFSVGVSIDAVGMYHHSHLYFVQYIPVFKIKASPMVPDWQVWGRLWTENFFRISFLFHVYALHTAGPATFGD